MIRRLHELDLLQESCRNSRLEMDDGSWTGSINNIEILVNEDIVSSFKSYSDHIIIITD